MMDRKKLLENTSKYLSILYKDIENIPDNDHQKKADIYRSILANLSVKEILQKQPSWSSCEFLNKLSEYRKLVDTQDTSEGLKNYAGPIITNISNPAKANQNMTVELTKEDILSIYDSIKPSDSTCHSLPSELSETFRSMSIALQENRKKHKPLDVNVLNNEYLTSKHEAITTFSEPKTIRISGSEKDTIKSIEIKSGLKYNSPMPLKDESNSLYQRSESKYSQEIQTNQRRKNPFSTYETSEKKFRYDAHEYSTNTTNTTASLPNFSMIGAVQPESDETIQDLIGCYGNFRTARQQLNSLNVKNKNGSSLLSSYGSAKRSLGTRRGVGSKFTPPIRDAEFSNELSRNNVAGVEKNTFVGDERLKNIDPKMVELIENEIMDQGTPVTWSQIAGLEFAKKTIKEIVVLPMLRPDIFTGLRRPPKGILLFGPPGTGKTLIGKCLASQAKATFFSISASSLTSKWFGEGEKMVRALFAVARCRQPAVIFIDEVDSLLTSRTSSDAESSRRIKTEFLVQLDGATTSSDDRILLVGATNRPQELDEAARRRFVKRLYIPLPESQARKEIVAGLLTGQRNNLSEQDIHSICSLTDGFSGADMANLCKEAALGPIRDISLDDIAQISSDEVRPITMADFEEALHHVRPSVSSDDLNFYIEWNKTFGSGA